jgi:hypothetical protein
MGKIANLKRFRKQKARQEKAQTAEENRTRSGRTGEQKKLEKAASAKAADFLDRHRRDKPPSSEGKLKDKS